MLNPVENRQRNLRAAARLSAEEYPKVNQIVQNDIYVDDCWSGEDNVEIPLKRADELELALNRDSFKRNQIHWR